MNENPERILLFRTDRLGDVILTAPAATLLHERFPRAHLTFVARPYTAELLRLHPHVNEVLSYEPEAGHRVASGFRDLVDRLRQGRYDVAIFFHPRPRLALAAWSARIPLRIGTRYRWYSALFNCRLPQRRKHGGKHELQYNLDLLQPLVDSLPREVEFRFVLPPELRAWRQEWLRAHGLEGGYMILHPGSGGSAPNLVPSQYRLVASTLLEGSSLPLVLTGNAAERPMTETLRSSLASNRVLNVAGESNLLQLAALLEGASLFVSSSTGPLHLANAFGVPIVAFYCPSPPCSPQRWGPYGQPEWVLSPDVIPCAHGAPARCPHGNCLETIPATELRGILSRQLAKLGATSST